MSCSHTNLRCMGFYNPIRTYICQECGAVFICECDKEIVENLLPSQLMRAREFGTRVEYEIQGFLPNICDSCKGISESPHPMRYGNKLERYYWREIKKTYYLSILEWCREKDISLQPIWNIEKKYPKITKELEKKAKDTWKKIHKSNPKYDMSEPSQNYYLENLHIPIKELSLESQKRKQGKKNVTKWIVDSTPYDAIESAVAKIYENQGFKVWFCEMKLISTLVGVFGILAKNFDPGIRLSYNHLTTNWKERSTINKENLLTKHIQHGTREYYLRQEFQVEELLKVLSNTQDLSELFESLLLKENASQNLSHMPTMSLRAQLGAEGEYPIELTRSALSSIPRENIISMIEWAIIDFYDRRGGWPDLLCVKQNEYRFVEVKSPTDKIRPEQFEWFNWANEQGIECELCIVK